jgi:hypothetical protein
MKALESPECGGVSRATFPVETVREYLLGERAVMAKFLGRPLDKIEVTGVVLRNVTSSSGDALVRSDLSTNVAGNDDWVSYAIHDGRWKTSDCHAPIGSTSSSSDGTVAAYCVMNACTTP